MTDGALIRVNYEKINKYKEKGLTSRTKINFTIRSYIKGQIEYLNKYIKDRKSNIQEKRAKDNLSLYQKNFRDEVIQLELGCAVFTMLLLHFCYSLQSLI